MGDLINDIRTRKREPSSRNGGANARKSRLPLSTFLIYLDRHQPIGMTSTEKKKMGAIWKKVWSI